MAEIVLRVRLVSGEHLDVTYDDDDDGSPDQMVERVAETLAKDSGVLRCQHGDRLTVVYGRGVASFEVAPRGAVLLEPDHPGERCHDPDFPGSEVDDHGGIALEKDDAAEPVLLVGHQVVQFEALDGRILGRGLEGA
jgi:hypothetical protein